MSYIVTRTDNVTLQLSTKVYEMFVYKINRKNTNERTEVTVIEKLRLVKGK